jgi:hypothetical protein
VTWKGTFRGSIRFDPDAHLPGFVRKGSFEGTVQTVPCWNCPRASKPPSFDPGAGGIDVDATSCDGRSFDANVEVDPATPPPPPGGGEATPADFNASWTKSVGIARVTYSIWVEGARHRRLLRRSQRRHDQALEIDPPDPSVRSVHDQS